MDRPNLRDGEQPSNLKEYYEQSVVNLDVALVSVWNDSSTLRATLNELDRLLSVMVDDLALTPEDEFEELSDRAAEMLQGARSLFDRVHQARSAHDRLRAVRLGRLVG